MWVNVQQFCAAVQIIAGDDPIELRGRRLACRGGLLSDLLKGNGLRVSKVIRDACLGKSDPDAQAKRRWIDSFLRGDEGYREAVAKAVPDVSSSIRLRTAVRDAFAARA